MIGTLAFRLSELSHLTQLTLTQVTALTPAVNPVLTLGEWHSGIFDRGKAECVPYEADHKHYPNPCSTSSWHVAGDASELDPSPVQVAAAQQGSELLVIVTGGHDRQPLSSQLARTMGTNVQLAQLRADEMYRAFKGELERQLQALPRERWPQLRPILTTRAAHDVTAAQEADRTGTLTLIRLGPPQERSK